MDGKSLQRIHAGENGGHAGSHAHQYEMVERLCNAGRQDFVYSWKCQISRLQSRISISSRYYSVWRSASNKLTATAGTCGCARPSSFRLWEGNAKSRAWVSTKQGRAVQGQTQAVQCKASPGPGQKSKEDWIHEGIQQDYTWKATSTIALPEILCATQRKKKLVSVFKAIVFWILLLPKLLRKPFGQQFIDFRLCKSGRPFV